MPDDRASSTDPPVAFGAAARPGDKPAVLYPVRVLLPLPLPAALDYLAPEGGAPPQPGAFVRVPLGVRSLVGVVWGGADGELHRSGERYAHAHRAVAGQHGRRRDL